MPHILLKILHPEIYQIQKLQFPGKNPDSNHNLNFEFESRDTGMLEFWHDGFRGVQYFQWKLCYTLRYIEGRFMYIEDMSIDLEDRSCALPHISNSANVYTSTRHQQHFNDTSAASQAHIYNTSTTSPTHQQHINNTSTTHHQHINNTSTHRPRKSPCKKAMFGEDD